MADEISLYGLADLHLYSDTRRRSHASDLYAQAAAGIHGSPTGAAPLELIGNWREIDPEAWLLVAGDLSDSMTQGGIHADYALLNELPGKKIMSPGNHDGPPWDRQLKVERFMLQWPTLHPITFGAKRTSLTEDAPGLVVVATRGACGPKDPWFGEEYVAYGPQNPMARYTKELGRLADALAQGEKLAQPGDRLAVQIHYPPFDALDPRQHPNSFTNLIEESGADFCVFGHLHTAEERDQVFQGQLSRNGPEYRLVSAPALENRLLPIGSLGPDGVDWASF